MNYPPIVPVLAEISDKLPGIPLVWALSIVIGALFIAAFCFSRWSLVVSFPLVTWIAVCLWREFILDTYFRQAVVAELGRGYLFQVVGAGCLPLFALLAWSAHYLCRWGAEPVVSPKGSSKHEQE